MIVQTNEQKQYEKKLMTSTLINILNAKGAIYWHYKNKQKREETNERRTSKIRV